MKPALLEAAKIYGQISVEKELQTKTKLRNPSAKVKFQENSNVRFPVTSVRRTHERNGSATQHNFQDLQHAKTFSKFKYGVKIIGLYPHLDKKV